jgi:MFS family permease
MVRKTWPLVASLGVTQTVAWASTYYLPAVLADPISLTLGIDASDFYLAFSMALVVSAVFGPMFGRAIDTLSRHRVLPASNVLFAAGLALLGFANSELELYLSWFVIGLGMAGGLYESAFSTLVRIYGQDARSAITGITLIAGFASTVGWPLSGWILSYWGWREACWTWAFIHLLLALPLNLAIDWLSAVKPSAMSYSNDDRETTTQTPIAPSTDEKAPTLKQALLLSFVFSATWFTSTAMASHWPRMLEATGVSLVAAIAIGAIIGPAQVIARVLEFGLLRKVHPLFSARLAAMAHPIGALLVALFGPLAAPVFAFLHGAGNGVLTIAKGTLPLALFGSSGYGYRQGWIMFPARISSAFAPWIFGLALTQWGAGALGVTFALGALSVFALNAINVKK